MPSSIARKLWMPLILISGIAASSLVQGWVVSRPSANESDYRQSLKLLFDTTNSTLRSLEYKTQPAPTQEDLRSTH